MQTLQTFITQLEKGRALHISVLDLSGALNTPLTRVEFKYAIHSKSFCDIAKSTDKGYNACILCKMVANRKAAEEKKPFCGYCRYGIFEAAWPVVVNEDTVAVVYVGNAVTDIEETEKRIKRTSKQTAVDSIELIRRLSECEYVKDGEELMQIAEIVSDYIKLLLSVAPREKGELHWIVSLLKQHADERCCEELSLKEIALTYRMNEKYIGRLFKENIGVSFGEYYTALRIKKAEKLLLTTDKKIIDVALTCGFNSISYFNKLFFKKYGVSPRMFRYKKQILF